MKNCDCNQGRLPCTCKPVPPAGDVEVPRYDMSGFGDGMIEIAGGAFVYFDDHLAHFTRLTAERDGLLADGRCMTAARNSLRLQVNDLLISERSLNEEANALQSELTKARELLAVLVDECLRGTAVAQIFAVKTAQQYLAHQSAPAAKGGV